MAGKPKMKLDEALALLDLPTPKLPSKTAEADLKAWKEGPLLAVLRHPGMGV